MPAVRVFASVESIEVCRFETDTLRLRGFSGALPAFGGVEPAAVPDVAVLHLGVRPEDEVRDWVTRCFASSGGAVLAADVPPTFNAVVVVFGLAVALAAPVTCGLCGVAVESVVCCLFLPS